ncbi:Tripartite ATP-independent periplasmic transporters, DctQ component [Roseivivax jejudonensis]|uniref:TRAP transporter small permease protein n=1 Tax=Roseivivax jejudonensis TaxID=1529041 RepID=A0A1X6ZAI0_9RHOB|nr:TRAP transporter small permease subunit [Roseivivax jejudonensis]SLN43699.1 Tripartite ATP-independent periplasmic transporters, DctQ component [Roseivivax jejudonensis]
MPDISYTLPHWLYWVGLIVFPLIAMALARRPKVEDKQYSMSLGYMILVTGGMLGLHRFYLKSLWGFVFIPVFLLILYANGQQKDAREVVSNLANQVRVAERSIEREEPRVEDARAEIEQYRADLAEAEEGSFTERAAQRRLDRAETTIQRGEERLAEARATLGQMQVPLEEARGDLIYWNNFARYAFYLLLIMMLVDAVLMKRLVVQANRTIEPDEEHANEQALRDAGIGVSTPDEAYAENWIDRLCLRAGEFVAYWAVIAVFVYYFEVISRYVFNAPTNWAHEAMYLMFGMQYLIAGAYAMLTETHVRVDIFYATWTRERKAWVDLLTSIFFFIFAFTLLGTSFIFAMDALAVPTGNGLLSQWARGDIATTEMVANWNWGQWTDDNIRWGEISFNEWEVPLWPMKWVMVIGGLLLVLQGVSKLLKDVRALQEG